MNNRKKHKTFRMDSNPRIKMDEFELSKFKEGILKFGPNITKIAQYIGTRSESQV